MILHTFTPQDLAEYQLYIEHHPHATPYHNRAWSKAVESSYGFDPMYFGLKQDHDIKAVMPCVLMKTLKGKYNLCSLPYCDMGGVLGNDAKAVAELIQQVTRHAKASNWSFEYRGTAKPAIYSDERSKESNVNVQADTENIADGTKVRMIYELCDNEETHMASFKPKLRSQIKKAIKNGITSTVIASPSAQDIDTFYAVFAANMRDLGSPVHSKKWFTSIFEAYKSSAFLVLVMFENECVGGGVVIHTNNKAVIPWASTLREFNKLAPNMLLYWEVLCEVMRRNIHHFDFGRSGYNEGTYRFKKQWGAMPEVLQWQSLQDGELIDETTSEKSAMRQYVETTWQKLPLGLTIALGPKIRKFISL